MKPFKAIAAMSVNRVIGCGNRIPWHLPEDLQWVKKMTSGHIIVMGRKTYESIGHPLPNRENIVLSHAMKDKKGIRVIRDLKALYSLETEKEVWIFGGAEIYRLALFRCSDLYLTIVKREVEGDVFFPQFENIFELKEIVRDEPEFSHRLYVNINFKSALFS